MRKIIILGIAFIVICTSFKSKEYVLSDYRDNYTGTYFCNSVCNQSNYQTKRPDFKTDTTNITISKAGQDSIIIVHLHGKSLQVKLNGRYLQAFPGSGHYGGEFISADSIDFSYSQGLSLICRYKGRKK